MNTHAIIAITTDGRRFELGRMGSLEKAMQLGRMLQDEIGDEYARFELVELDPTGAFKESLAELGIRDFHMSYTRHAH
jgi:hypothetical protein